MLRQEIYLKRSDVLPKWYNTYLKPRWATEAYLRKTAARMIEYRAMGLSWEECEDLIRSTDLGPFYNEADSVRRIAEWRLENVHEDKTGMPPEQWRSPEDVRREAARARYLSWKEEHREKFNHYSVEREKWRNAEVAKRPSDPEYPLKDWEAWYVKEFGPCPVYENSHELERLLRKDVENFAKAQREALAAG